MFTGRLMQPIREAIYLYIYDTKNYGVSSENLCLFNSALVWSRHLQVNSKKWKPGDKQLPWERILPLKLQNVFC